MAKIIKRIFKKTGDGTSDIDYYDLGAEAENIDYQANTVDWRLNHHIYGTCTGHSGDGHNVRLQVTPDSKYFTTSPAIHDGCFLTVYFPETIKYDFATTDSLTQIELVDLNKTYPVKYHGGNFPVVMTKQALSPGTGSASYEPTAVIQAGDSITFKLKDSNWQVASRLYIVEYAEHAVESDKATFAENAGTANRAVDADHATNATHATDADNAKEASHATSATKADNATHATNADNADTAASACKANFATRALSADNATHATNADHAINANHADSAASACKATLADLATRALSADNAKKADNALKVRPRVFNFTPTLYQYKKSENDNCCNNQPHLIQISKTGNSLASATSYRVGDIVFFKGQTELNANANDINDPTTEGLISECYLHMPYPGDGISGLNIGTQYNTFKHGGNGQVFFAFDDKFGGKLKNQSATTLAAFKNGNNGTYSDKLVVLPLGLNFQCSEGAIMHFSGWYIAQSEDDNIDEKK